MHLLGCSLHQCQGQALYNCTETTVTMTFDPQNELIYSSNTADPIIDIYMSTDHLPS